MNKSAEVVQQQIAQREEATRALKLSQMEVATLQLQITAFEEELEKVGRIFIYAWAHISIYPYAHMLINS